MNYEKTEQGWINKGKPLLCLCGEKADIILQGKGYCYECYNIYLAGLKEQNKRMSERLKSL